MELSQRLRLWSDELRAISNEGLHWDRDNPYGVRRRGELSGAVFDRT